MKVAFAGTPEFAATALRAILAAGHEVPLVLTQPDRPAGRGMKLHPSPVKQLALQHGIAVSQPQRLRSEEERAPLRAAAADVLVVAAYGIILPQAVLDMPHHGCLNIHASLLPRWRGAAPIHRAIEAGDAETGITIMQMDAGLDTGAMLLRRSIEILPDDTTASLHDRLARLGGEMIVDALAQLPAGLAATEQPADGVTYAHKIDKAEARLDFSLPADQVERQVRAFAPAPGAFFELEGERYKVFEAETGSGGGWPGQVLDDRLTIATGRGTIRPTRIQRAGKPAMDTGELLRGRPIAAGTYLNTGN